MLTQMTNFMTRISNHKFTWLRTLAMTDRLPIKVTLKFFSVMAIKC